MGKETGEREKRRFAARRERQVRVRGRRPLLCVITYSEVSLLPNTEKKDTEAYLQ